MSDFSFDFESEDHQDLTSIEVARIDLNDFREVGAISYIKGFLSDEDGKRIQSYPFDMGIGEEFYLTRADGFLAISPKVRCFTLEVMDEAGQIIVIHLNPELVWKTTRYWINADLVEWSIDKEDYILDLVASSIGNLLDYFGWSIRQILNDELNGYENERDLIYLLDKSEVPQVIIQGSKETLMDIELHIRTFCEPYHQDCLWLGRKVRFQLHAYLDAMHSQTDLDSFFELNPGDLLHIKQTWVNNEIVRIPAKVICLGKAGKKWVKKVFLRIDNEDARMEFDNNEWEEDEFAGDTFTTGEDGPDAVHLNLSIGNTVLSFNELCNIQEGSLIELKKTTLPIVSLTMGDETILDCELVRLNDKLMIQVIRKVE